MHTPRVSTTPKLPNTNKSGFKPYYDKIKHVFPNFSCQFNANQPSSSHCHQAAYSNTILAAKNKFQNDELVLFKKQIENLNQKFFQKCCEVQKLKKELLAFKPKTAYEQQDDVQIHPAIDRIQRYHAIEKQKIIHEYERKVRQIERSKENALNQKQLEAQLEFEEHKVKQDELNKQIEHLEKETKELKKILTSANSEGPHEDLVSISKCKYIQESYHSFQVNLDITNQKIQIVNLKQENSALRNFIQQKDNMIQSAHKQLRSLQESTERSFKAQLDQLTAQLISYKNQLLNQQRISSENIQKLTDKYEGEIREQMTQINKLKLELGTQKAEYENKVKQCKNQCEMSARKSVILEQSLNKKISLSNSKQQMRQSMVSSRKQSEIIESQYKSIVSGKVQQIKVLELELSEFKKKQINCYKQIEELRAYKVSSAYQVSNLENTISILRDQIRLIQSKHEEKVAQLNQRIKQAGETGHKDLQQVHSKLIEQLQLFRSKKEEVEKQKNYIEHSYRAQMDKLMFQIENMSKKISQLELLIEKEEAARQQQHCSREEVESRYEALLADKRLTIQQLQDSKGQLQNQIIALEIENCDFKTKLEIDSLERQKYIKNIELMKEQQQKLIKLTTYIKELESKQQAMEDSLSSLSVQKEALEQDLQAQKILVEELRECNKKLQEQGSSIRAQNDSLEKKFLLLEGQNNLLNLRNLQSFQTLEAIRQNKQKLLKQLEENNKVHLSQIESRQKHWFEEYQQLQKKFKQQVKKQRNYQITSTKQKQTLEHYKGQISDLKEYILKITEEKEKLHEHIHQINQFYCQLMEAKMYNQKIIESSESFRKVKVQEFLAEKKIVFEDENQLENASEVFTIPDFSQKKQSSLTNPIMEPSPIQNEPDTKSNEQKGNTLEPAE